MFNIKIKHNNFNVAEILSKTIYINNNIKSIKTYIRALHEIGHILNDQPCSVHDLNVLIYNYIYIKNNSFVSKFRMQSEIKAWKKAYELAKWSNFTADKQTVFCLLSYIYDYNKCHKKPFKNLNNTFILKFMKCHINNKNKVLKLKNILFS